MGLIFTVYSKNTGAISSIFVGTLGTLGQHEFAFGFCGYIGVEISRVRRKWVAASTLVFILHHSHNLLDYAGLCWIYRQHSTRLIMPRYCDAWRRHTVLLDVFEAGSSPVWSATRIGPRTDTVLAIYSGLIAAC